MNWYLFSRQYFLVQRIEGSSLNKSSNNLIPCRYFLKIVSIFWDGFLMLESNLSVLKLFYWYRYNSFLVLIRTTYSLCRYFLSVFLPVNLDFHHFWITIIGLAFKYNYLAMLISRIIEDKNYKSFYGFGISIKGNPDLIYGWCLYAKFNIPVYLSS